MNNKELQAAVNPCYTTAKGILNLLIAGGDPDAIKLVPYLNLKDQSKANPEKMPPPEMINCFKIGQMTRFDFHNTIALMSGKQTIVDLPCGYATRCFKVADNGQNYYGFDLPIVVDEMKELTSKIMTEKQKPFISFNAVDATNYESMRQALKDVKGEICIITEGIFSYLNDSEIISTCQAIHKLLSEFGGCWVTADGSGSNDVYPLTLGAIYQGDKEQMYKIMENIASSMSNVQSYTNTFTRNKFEKAKEFIEKQGFIITEESVSKYLHKLKCFPEGKEDALIAAFSNIKFWTLVVDKKDEINYNEEKKIFNLECNLVLNINIEGRLDTLSSPELLKKFQEAQGIKGVKIDVSKLNFISSAGIRVLKMILKELENKEMLEITGANDEIKETLKNEGFESNLK